MVERPLFFEFFEGEIDYGSEGEKKDRDTPDREGEEGESEDAECPQNPDDEECAEHSGMHCGK